jgi:DNA-binding MarR family transcriptional regulator
MSEDQDNISEREDIVAEGGADHVDHVVAQWAQARPDLDTAPIAVVARLGRATAYVDAGVNARLAEFGLTRNLWDVLAALRRCGAPYRRSPTDLYLALMRTSGAMTHRLAHLERAGLIRRVPNPEDGRGMLVELTHKGVRLVDRVAPAHLAAERDLLEPLTAEEQETLAALLRKLLQTLERDEPGPPAGGRGRRRKDVVPKRSAPRG